MAENEQTNPPAANPVDPPPGSPPLDTAARISELEGLLAGKTEELNKAGTRLAELESSASVAAAAVDEANSRADRLAESLKTVFSGYKSLIVQSNPDIPAELLTGDNVEALDGSLSRARELIEKVKKSIDSQKSTDRVPAGAPPRGAPDTSGLSSREKISQGVEKARGR
ncbi:MAG: hypothetical protein JXA46_08220 [Dehalococcoidales bacterium]|nr:hypothetical protein [Dehalococcoidales bacterium]